MSNTDLRRGQLGGLRQIGKGGTAFVYAVNHPGIGPHPEVVFKEYRQSVRRSAGPGLLPGLRSIVGFLDQLEPAPRRFFDQRMIWPLRVVVNDDGDAAQGIIMRLIPREFFQDINLPSGRREREPSELQFLLMGDEDASKAGVEVPNIPDRIQICAQMARSFGLLHHSGVVYGDISARNAVYHLHGRAPEVLLVDCDSVRVRGTRSPFRSQPHTPRWEPPEALAARSALRRAHRSGSAVSSSVSSLQHQAVVQSKETDVYKFGLLMVRILDYGRYRSANRDPAKAAALLGYHVGNAAVDLLYRTLAESPGDRPSMREWYEVIVGRSVASRSGLATMERTAGVHHDQPSKSTPIHLSAGTEVQSVHANVGSWRWTEGVGWSRSKA